MPDETTSESGQTQGGQPSQESGSGIQTPTESQPPTPDPENPPPPPTLLIKSADPTESLDRETRQQQS